jgi:hypothetical protein
VETAFSIAADSADRIAKTKLGFIHGPTDYGRSVGETVSEPVVWLKAMALGAPFHVWSATLVAALTFASGRFL